MFHVGQKRLTFSWWFYRTVFTCSRPFQQHTPQAVRFLRQAPDISNKQLQWKSFPQSLLTVPDIFHFHALSLRLLVSIFCFFAVRFYETLFLLFPLMAKYLCSVSRFTSSLCSDRPLTSHWYQSVQRTLYCWQSDNNTTKMPFFVHEWVNILHTWVWVHDLHMDDVGSAMPRLTKCKTFILKKNL